MTTSALYLCLEKKEDPPKERNFMKTKKCNESFVTMTELVLPNDTNGLDNLMIYYSGHGFYDDSFNEGYWIPYDAKVGDVSTYIPNTNILNFVKALEFRHIFLVADACFSGALFSEGNRGFIDNIEEIQSRYGLSSGNIEFVSDGKAGENSPFATYFLKFLKSNLKDRFTVEELNRYVKVAVGDNSNQQPIAGPLKNVGHEGGEFVFYLK